MKSTKDKTELPQDFPVVGIGAREGGIDAIIELTSQIKQDSGMAYVVAYYGEPQDRPLSEILSAKANIPVKEIISTVDLVPDQIFLMPSNTVLTAEYGVLKLVPPARKAREHHPVDALFTSLAEVHRSRAVAVVLSGETFDGAAGLKVVKEFGGATIAQDPATAHFKGMPLAAIDGHATDYIVPPLGIAEKLSQIRHIYEANYGYTEREEMPVDEEEVLTEINKIILSRTGNNFQHYKKPTIRRRIARRMIMSGREHISDYLNYLRNETAEQELLFNDLLIPVSYFFRDPKVFASLRSTVFPRLVQKAAGGTLRIWVAGCSTGEEAYSMAISLHEFMTQRNEVLRVQIFASDISPVAISKARTGIYTPQDLQNVSQERLANYFTKRDGIYHVKKVIRDMCVFAIHNIVSDPPFTRIDLISCRNVLIYFNTLLQEKAFDMFHYALREEGYLLLGQSESTIASHLFDVLGRSEKVYTKKFAPGRHTSIPFRPAAYTMEKAEDIGIIPVANFSKLLSDVLFQHYTPACVIINAQHQIMHFHGDTAPYLQPSPGRPDFNILKMARAGLGFELRNALVLAKESGGIVRKDGIAIPNAGFLAGIEVLPLEGGNYTLVLFRSEAPVHPYIATEPGTAAQEERIREMEMELSQMRNDIKRVTDEQQLAYEELQVSNEELIAGSEELQILNEEFQTAAEELQSNNEELTCVNDELMDRHEQLLSMRHYAESIIDTIHEPLVVLTHDMRIRSANPAFFSYFSTVEEIAGRSLFEVGAKRWDIPELRQMLETILKQREGIENQRLRTAFPHIGERILLLNARMIVSEKPTDLILLAIADITDIEHFNEKLMAKNNELELNNQQLKSFSWAASHDLQEPLRKILMFSRMIADEDLGLSEKSRFSLGRIAQASENMMVLVKDLMGYTATIAPEGPPKRTDLNILLKKAMAELKEIIREHNVVIQAGGLPILEVLPEQFRQLLSNLIVNSIKYRREDAPPKIEISASIASAEEIIEIEGNQDREYQKVIVRDNGIGFDDNHSENIFNPFVRLHGRDRYSGSGLGLTLCRQIVRNHNGIIKASGNVEGGATITIYIPAGQEQDTP